MSKENEIKFKEPKIYLEFCVYDYNDNDQAVFIEISCGEDMESYLQDYFKENWNDLFFNKVPNIDDIEYATLEGVRVIAKEDNNELNAGIYKRTSALRVAKVKFDIDSLKDVNAQKLKEIREILDQ